MAAAVPIALGGWMLLGDAGKGRPMAPITASDAERLIHNLYEQTGHRLEFVGMPVLGETGGAAFVRWPDGRAGVMSRSARGKSELAHTGDILDHLRSHGIPAPRFDLIAELEDCTVVVQERLPGEPTPRHIDRPMMAAIVSTAESFRGVLAGRHDVRLFELVLDGQRTDTLAGYDDRSRRLLGWITSVSARRPSIRGDDVIHCDYHRDNILFDTDRELTGIVDWHEGNLRRGDWRYHLINLAFDFAWALAREWNLIDPAAMQLLNNAIATINPELLDTFWAHHALLAVNMLITRRWYPDADALIDFALSRVPE